MTGTLPEREIDKYLRLVIERKIADAEKELDDLRPKITDTTWNRGYFKALEGLLLTRKSNDDHYLFFAKKEFDRKSLKTIMKEFGEYAESPLYGDYDRGYFSGLVRLVKAMENAGVYTLSNNSRNHVEEAKAAAQ
jgi:hypothetical protein